MITFRIEDHSSDCLEELDRRVRLLLGSVAEELVRVYKNDSTGLGAVWSHETEDGPPHSSVGEVPHHYNGPLNSGYSAPAPGSFKNNAPGSGFAVEQQDFLFEFIDHYVSEPGEPPEAGVGFNLQTSANGAPAHVVSRNKNYLIQWDRGDIPQRTPRPKADETFDRKTGQIRKKRKTGRPRVRDYQSTGQRPWVRPLYDEGLPDLKRAAADAVASIRAGGTGGFEVF